MTQGARSAGTVIRRLIAAIILVPLAVVIIAFAVANRQIVVVSLDPFSAEHPAASLTLPLFALVIVLLVLGVLIGGIAAWLRQSKWRRTARRLEREMADLHLEIEAIKRTAGMPGGSFNARAARAPAIAAAGALGHPGQIGWQVAGNGLARQSRRRDVERAASRP